MAFKPDFISGYTVELPQIKGPLKNDIAPLKNGNGYIIDYAHHSLALNKNRKFAFFSASNINGPDWKAIARSGSFSKDVKAVDPDFQLGKELYDAIKSKGKKKNDFEEGHLTSFQEVLWGNAAEKKKAASDTFHYTNCVPQHERLNSGLWRSLEQYILKSETVDHGLKVIVITGPVLLDTDPWFVKKVNGEYVQVPLAFWKLVYYPNKNGLNVVGFMMSHKQLLVKDGTVTYTKDNVRGITAVPPEAEELFMDYKYDDVYQVDVKAIIELTGLNFTLKGVKQPFRKKEKKALLLKRIEVTRSFNRDGIPAAPADLDFEVGGISL
ncbi:MAG: DNA/RNA non-specific endonuclease [Ferruginibacter sp.]